MKVKERLQKLHDENYRVRHKFLGLVEMDELDVIRVRGVEKGSTIKNYCDFVYAERLTKENIMQYMDNELLEKEIIHEEIWMLGSDCALDMFINIE